MNGSQGYVQYISIEFCNYYITNDWVEGFKYLSTIDIKMKLHQIPSD